MKTLTLGRAKQQVYLCGGCEHFHPYGWTGDCRDNGKRFTYDRLDATYPGAWIEVDEESGEPIDPSESTTVK